MIFASLLLMLHRIQSVQDPSESLRQVEIEGVKMVPQAPSKVVFPDDQVTSYIQDQLNVRGVHIRKTPKPDDGRGTILRIYQEVLPIYAGSKEPVAYAIFVEMDCEKDFLLTTKYYWQESVMQESGPTKEDLKQKVTLAYQGLAQFFSKDWKKVHK